MSNTLTCPVPNDFQPLTINGFQFTITRLPGISFFCQEASLPGLTLPYIGVNTPLSKLRFASDQIDYENLSITFMIDSSMNNYSALLDWFVGLGFPEYSDQYKEYQASVSDGFNVAQNNDASPGTLIILGPNNKPVRTVDFLDLIPLSIQSVTFSSTEKDVKYAMGRATFAYTLFKFK